MRKILTYGVVIATIVWSLGLAAVVPLASATYSPSEGDLIKTATDSAVYYIDADGERNLFVNEVTYWTWKSGTWATQGIKTISQSDFDSLEVGGHVVARPGVKLIKFQNSPKTYAVLPGAKLAYITTEAAAAALYGSNWKNRIVTVQNGFENDYSKTGADLTADSKLPDGSLVKYQGTEEIYYIDGGEKRLVSDDAFVANNFQDSAVLTVAAAMSYETGNGITGEEAAISTIAGSGSSVPPAVAGTLTVALASDTPASGLAIYNAARMPFTTVTLTASADADVTVDNVTIERTGAAADADISSVALVDADTNVQIGLNQNLNSNHQANVNDDFVVKAGTTKKVILAANLAATGAGQTPSLSLAALTLKSGTLVGTLPITGNVQTMTNLTIGQATVQRGNFAPATNTSAKVGKEYVVASFKITADSTEGQKVKQIKFYNQGTASLSDLESYKLLVDNVTPVDAVFTQSGKYLTAEFSGAGITMDKGGNEELTLKATIKDGSTRTIKFGIYRTTDVIAAGTTYGYSRTCAYSGTGYHAAGNPVLTSDQLTISAGTVRVDSNLIKVGAQNVAYGDDQILGSWDVVVQGEAANITQLILSNSSSTMTSINSDNWEIIDDNGQILWGPSSPTAGSITYSSSVQLPVGTNTLRVRADLKSTAGFAANETFDFRINPANITATGATTAETITATPSSNVSAATQTFKTAALTVTRNSIPADGNIISPSTNVKFGSWTFDTSSSGEDVKISVIKIGDRHATTTNSDALRLFDASLTSETTCKAAYPNATYNSLGCQIASEDGSHDTTTFTLTDPINQAKATSKVIELYGNVRSSVAGNYEEYGMFSTAASDGVTAVGKTSNTSITVSGSAVTAFSGANFLITSAGTITINTAGTFSNRLIQIGETRELNRLKLKATNEAIDVSELALCIDDYNAAYGMETGSSTVVTSFSVYKATDMTAPIITGNIPNGSKCRTFTLSKGVLQIPNTTAGLEVVIKGTMASEIGASKAVTESGPGIKIGIGGTDGIKGTGVNSNTTASETITASTSTGYKLVVSYPTITINALPDSDAYISSGSVLADFTINNPTANPLAVYRMSFFVATTGDADLFVSKLYLREYSTMKKVAATATLHGEGNGGKGNTTSFALWDPDDITQTQRSYYIGSGNSARFQLVVDTVSGQDATHDGNFLTYLIYDEATTTASNEVGRINLAANYVPMNGVGGMGNFVWSDLWTNDAYDAAASNATGSAQWWNGNWVEGLASASGTPWSRKE